MRILLLHSSSDSYGASKIFLQTAKLLKNKGHQLLVVLPQEGPLKQQMEAMGIEVVLLNLAVLRRKYFNLAGIINRYQKWKSAVRILGGLVKEQEIDTIYSNTAAVLVGGYIAKKYRIRHIWHIHEIIDRPQLLHQCLAWALRHWATEIIAVSKAVAIHWQDAIPKNKKTGNTPHQPTILQVYNGIAPLTRSASKTYRAALPIPEEALVIGMAARIHFWKGQSYFVEIAKSLLARENLHQRPLYFMIAGDPFPGYEHLQIVLENAIKAQPLADRIFYIGLVKEMDLFYRSINLLLLPSQLPDPLPTVVLEAMQYALPVVATAQGGALEMVVEEASLQLAPTGIFIPLNNVERAVAKIEKILVPETLDALGAAGQERVNTHFSEAAFEKNLLAIFEK